ncbi:MAG: HNH endonuclease [Gammaproteobacteria bacterium]|nr:HNH endonuclease [Gammaproteobacteria bacterium]
MVTALQRYHEVVRRIRRERGERCEACAVRARHPHHIIPVSETSIASELVYDPANMLILCDECHALMHPGLRNISDWGRARRERGQALNG